MKKPLVQTLALVALAIGAAPALAAPLPPSGVQVPVAAEADPTGGMVIDSSSMPFSVPGSFTGTLSSSVISGDPSNPFGGLTFVYLLTNASGPNSIGRFSVDGFLGFSADVSYDVASGGKAPAFADRNPFGDVIGFSFLPIPLDLATGFMSPGSTSRRMVVQTNALRYHSVTGSLIDGGVTTVPTFGPTVPEPSSLALAAIGLAGMLVRYRRRSR